MKPLLDGFIRVLAGPRMHRQRISPGIIALRRVVRPLGAL
jgi:hypothetical protein